MTQQEETAAAQVKKPEFDREGAKAEIARLLKAFLKHVQRKPPWLAEQIGVHRSTAARLVKGEILPDPQHCQRLAELTGENVQKWLTLAGHLPTGVGVKPGAGRGWVGGGEGETNFPNLADQELGFYLSQIGAMPEKTQQIIKSILRDEFFILQKERMGPGRLTLTADSRVQEKQLESDPWPGPGLFPSLSPFPSDAIPDQQPAQTAQERPPFARPAPPPTPPTPAPAVENERDEGGQLPTLKSDSTREGDGLDYHD